MLDVQVQEIGMYEAKRLLESSEGNPRYLLKGRIVDKCFVNRIAGDIRDGKWNMGSNPIVLSQSGVLLDGHHRLSAVVKTGIPIKTIVVTGEVDSGHIDENRTRSISVRSGISRGAVAIMNLHYYALQISTQGYQNKTASIEWMREYLSKHENVKVAVQIGDTGKISGVPLFSRRSQTTYAIYLALQCGVARDELERFVKILNSGYMSELRDCTVVTMRNQLMNSRNTRTFSERYKESMNIQGAIVDYTNGKERKRSYNEVAGRLFDKYMKMGGCDEP